MEQSQAEIKYKPSMGRGKVVFITGASVGIGRETAFEFAKDNYFLALTYNENEEEAIDTGKKCMELGASDVLILNLDLRDNISIKNVVKKVIEKFKKIDILINNAGVISWKLLSEQSFEQIEEQTRVNLEGLIKITKECLPHIKDSIINISSGAGKVGIRNLTSYCATKFGVRGFTQALAQETTLKVFTVNPGMTATEMTNFRGTPPQKVAEVIFNTAKGKYNLPSGSDIDLWKFI